MARGEDITTRFKVDISDLKKGITEANRNIKLANAEFKAASSGMDDWGNSTEGISAKLKQLASVLTSQNSKLESYKRQLQAQEDAYAENGRRAEELKAKLQELSNQGVSKTSAEYKKYEQALNACEKEQMANKTAADNLKVTVLNQQAAVNKTEKEIRNYDQALENSKNEMNSTTSASNSLDRSLDNIDSSTVNATKGFTVMKGALSGLIYSGIQSAINGIKSLTTEAISSSDALYKFEQTMGFAGYDDKAIKKAKTDMKDYADRTVYDLQTVANTTAQLAANGIGDYTGLTKAAGNLNAVAGGNAETFKALAMMMTQTAGAGKLTTENWNQLADAIPGASGKMQEAMKQAGAYTGNFREAMEKGEITADEFNAAIMKLGNEPVAVEAATSVETFEGAVGNMQAAVVSGLMEIIEAVGMENITGFINSVTDGIEFLSPVIKALVGFIVNNGKIVIAVLTGITAAFAFNKINNGIRTVTEGFGVFRGAVDKTTASTGANTIANQLNTASIIQKKLATIGSTIAEKAATVGTKAWTLATKAATIGQKLLAVAMRAMPFALIVAGITALAVYMNKTGTSADELAKKITDGANKIAKKITEFANNLPSFINQIFPVITKAVSSIVQTVAKILPTLIAVVSKLIKSLVDTIVQMTPTIMDSVIEIVMAIVNVLPTLVPALLEAAITLLMAIVKAVPTIITALAGALPKLIKAIVDGLVQAIPLVIKGATKLLMSIVNALPSIITALIGALPTVIQAIINVLIKAIPLLTQAAITLFSTLIKVLPQILVSVGKTLFDGLATVFAPLSGWFKEKFTAAREAVKSVWSTVKLYFAGVWNDIKAPFKATATYFKTVFSQAWNNVKKVFSNVGSFFGGIWNTIRSKFSRLGTSIGSAISNSVKAGINGVIRQAENVINKAIGLINGAIRIINKLPGVTVGKVGRVSFPRLAQGGVLKRGQVGLLEGDGAEAVVPLEKNKQWIKRVSDELKSNLVGGTNSSAVSGANVNNFTQVINAPKAPSRIELYRDARNLLNYSKGGA